MENVVRMGRGGWRDAEINQLREAVRGAGGNGEPLRGVFERVGGLLGRKPNSVRNFYYAFLKREEAEQAPHAAPFQTFTSEEIRALMREVLGARAQGISVRACVQRMAGGDRKMMLRYQNKYRSVLKTRPALVREILAELAAEGAPTYDPYARAPQIQPLYASVAAAIHANGDPALLDLLRGLDTLLTRLGMVTPAALPAACETLVHTIKDFLGLPAAQRPQTLDAFCASLSEQIGAVENALAG